MPSDIYLILRNPRSGGLEGRTALMQRLRESFLTALVGAPQLLVVAERRQFGSGVETVPQRVDRRRIAPGGRRHVMDQRRAHDIPPQPHAALPSLLGGIRRVALQPDQPRATCAVHSP